MSREYIAEMVPIRRVIRMFVVTCALMLTRVPPVHGQHVEDVPKPGAVLLQGGLMVTSLLNDTQDTQAGYLHYNFVGTLHWPTTGATFGGGAFVARHWSVGAEAALRRRQSTMISEQEYEMTAHGRRTSTYASRERLLSAVLRFHLSPIRKVEIAPLGGVTKSWASRSLTARSGTFFPDGFASRPISAPDVTLKENKWGVIGGTDVGLAVGGGMTIVCSPRVQWIHRDEYDSYSHTVPYAARVITSLTIGVQWRATRSPETRNGS